MSFSYSSFRAFSAGSLIILTSVLLMLSFLALKSNKNELAAVLLAFTTIQPHFFVLVYILAIIWGISVQVELCNLVPGRNFILSILGAVRYTRLMLDYA
jgi:hypothetical protein